jgi:hypothetical protein
MEPPGALYALSMPRSKLAAALAFVAAVPVVACAQTSQAPTSVTAPTTSAAEPQPSPQPSPQPAPPAPSGPASAAPPMASAGPGADVDAGVAAQFRTCQKDADCVAVPRAGCCHNGWKEAVAASQRDAYEKANACTITPRPVCPMYIVRDPRIAKCDAQSKLCVLVQP